MRTVGSVALGGDDRVSFGSHALYRFHDHLCADQTLEQARTLLIEAAEECGEFKLSAPEGVHWADSLKDRILTEGWYCVSIRDPRRRGRMAQAVFPLVADPHGFSAITCLVRWE